MHICECPPSRIEVVAGNVRGGEGGVVQLWGGNIPQSVRRLLGRHVDYCWADSETAAAAVESVRWSVGSTVGNLSSVRRCATPSQISWADESRLCRPLTPLPPHRHTPPLRPAPPTSV